MTENNKVASEPSGQPGQTGFTSKQIAAYPGHKNCDITRHPYPHPLCENTTEVAHAPGADDLDSPDFSMDEKGAKSESQTP